MRIIATIGIALIITIILKVIQPSLEHCSSWVAAPHQLSKRPDRSALPPHPGRSCSRRRPGRAGWCESCWVCCWWALKATGFLLAKNGEFWGGNSPRFPIYSPGLCQSIVFNLELFDSSICCCLESSSVLGSQKRFLHKENSCTDSATQKHQTLRASSGI